MTEILIFFIITLVATVICRKFGLLPSYVGQSHQLFSNEKKIPLIGGFLFLMLSIYFFYEKNIFFCLIISLIFLIGFLSDSKILSSPKIRIFFQTIVISIAVYFLDIQISSTRIDLLDEIIEIRFEIHESPSVDRFAMGTCWTVMPTEPLAGRYCPRSPMHERASCGNTARGAWRS